MAGRVGGQDGHGRLEPDEDSLLRSQLVMGSRPALALALALALASRFPLRFHSLRASCVVHRAIASLHVVVVRSSIATPRPLLPERLVHQ